MALQILKVPVQYAKSVRSVEVRSMKTLKSFKLCSIFSYPRIESKGNRRKEQKKASSQKKEIRTCTQRKRKEGHACRKKKLLDAGKEETMHEEKRKTILHAKKGKEDQAKNQR
jgi:hypothetical protein